MAEDNEDQLNLDDLLSGLEAEAEAPVEEAPVEEAPVEEAPVEESPAAAAPVEEALIEEAPEATAAEVQAAAAVEVNVPSPEEDDIVAERARRLAQMKEQGAAIDAAAPPPTPEEKAAEIEASTDPNGWLEKISDWSGSEGDNLLDSYAKQYVDIYAGVVSAPVIVANNVIEAVDAAGEALHAAVPEDLQKAFASGKLDPIPFVGAIASSIQTAVDEDPLALPAYQASTVVGNVAQDIAQIAVTFIPAIKGVQLGTKAIVGGVKFTGAANLTVKAAESGVATVASEFFAWEASDATISTHLSGGADVEGQIEVFGVDINTAVLEYLSVDPEDGVLETRAKQALEGLLLGGAAGAVFETMKPIFRYGKSYVQSLEIFKKGIDDAGWGGINHTPTTAGADALDSVVPASGDVPASSPTTPRPATREEQIAARDAARALDPDAPGVAPLVPDDPDDLGVAHLRDVNPDTPVSVQMGGRVDAPTLADDVVEAMTTGTRSLDDVLKGVNYAGLTNPSAVRRLFTQAMDAVLIEKGFAPRGKVAVLDDATLEIESRRLGVTEEELLERQHKATAENAEYNEGSQRVVAAAEARLRDLTEAYKRNANNPLTVMAMSKQLRVTQVLKAERDTLATEAGRALRSSSGETATFDNPELIRLLDVVDPGKEVWTSKQISDALRELSEELPVGGTYSDEVIAAQIHLRNQGTAEDAAKLADLILDTKSDNMVKALKEVPSGVFANWTELLTSYQYFSMLSQISTHVVNSGSLVGSVVANIGERYTAEMLSRGWEKIAGVPVRKKGAWSGGVRIAPGEGNALAAGTITGIKVASRELVENLRLNLFGSVDEAGNVIKARGVDYVDPKARSTLKSELENQAGVTNRLGTRRFTGAQRGMGEVQAMFYDKIGMALNTTSVLLHTMDNFFRAITRVQETAAIAQRMVDTHKLTGEAADIMRREVMDAPPARVAFLAEKFAKESVFVEDATGPVKWLNDGVRDATGNWGGVWRVGMSMTIPFMRTTMNLAKWSGRRSPIGKLMKGVQEDTAKGGAAAAMANTRMIMGTATGTLAIYLWTEDLLTGPGPTDPGERATWLLTHQPNSIMIGGEWIPLDKFAPIGHVVRVWATAAETLSYLQDEEVADAMGATILATMQAMADVTVAESIINLLTIAESRQEGQNAKDLIADAIAKQLAPGFVKSAFKIFDDQDDIWYDTDTIWEAVRAKVPYLSNEGLAHHRNIWGFSIRRSTIGPDGVSPLTTGDFEPREIDDWLWDNRVGLTLPGRTVTFSKYGVVELTAHEFSRYVELAGNAAKMSIDGGPELGLYDFLNAVITGQAGDASTRWNSLTDTRPDGKMGSREIWITTKIIPAYRELARYTLLSSSISLEERRKAAADAQFDAFNPSLNPSHNEYDPRLNPTIN